jgi:hypothetical protein
MSTFNILSPESCGKRIARITKVGKALQSEIHLVATSLLSHLRDFGDYRQPIALLNGMPSGQRRNALAYWFGHFSTGAAIFSFDASNKTWKCKLDPKRVPEQFQVIEAWKTTFGDLVLEKSHSTFNLEGLMNFMKRKANEVGLNPDGTPKVEKEVRDTALIFYRALEDKILGRERAEAVQLSDLIVADQDDETVEAEAEVA